MPERAVTSSNTGRSVDPNTSVGAASSKEGSAMHLRFLDLVSNTKRQTEQLVSGRQDRKVSAAGTSQEAASSSQTSDLLLKEITLTFNKHLCN